MNPNSHPCFNDDKRHTVGRVHLPVAPRCNIQCRFCNRKYDCVNESRPGVTSGILTPAQAEIYLEEVLAQKKEIAVVGIAGPGDPFANPNETLETLDRVRRRHEEIILCVATNGLNILPHVKELARLKVSHITITANAVDPDIASKIYAWVRHDRRVHRAQKGSAILIEQQAAAVQALKEKGITVKINSIIIPGVNEEQIPVVAEKMKALGADIQNCIPYYKTKGSDFADLDSPTKESIAHIRKAAGIHLPQMRHCARCRADAAGLLGEKTDPRLLAALQKNCQTPAPNAPKPAQNPNRPYIAVASLEGVLVNQHLGEAHRFFIYDKENGTPKLIETRAAPEPGRGIRRWAAVSDTLKDCGTLMVSGIGQTPSQILKKEGIRIIEMEGLITEAIDALHAGKSLPHLLPRRKTTCTAVCSSTGGGCG